MRSARSSATTAVRRHRLTGERGQDLVNRQDLEIVERVQQGVANPAYTGGRMCYRFEEPLHRFQNMIIDRMVGIDRVPAGDDDTMTPMFMPAQTTGPAK